MRQLDRATLSLVRRRAGSNRSYAAALVLALLTTAFLPSQVLANIAADRCCADHCQDARSARMDLDCCGIEAGGDAQAATRQLETAPPVSAALTDLPSSSPWIARPIVESRDGASTDTGPPLFLRTRNLRL